MTMNLMSHAFSTNATRKIRSKHTTITPALIKECKAHNKSMKRLGMKEMAIEDYFAYRQGKYNPKLGGVVKSPTEAKSLQRTTPHIQSNGGGIDVAFATKPNTYTGTRIIGIAVLHKSCLQPVASKKDIEEISRMRRG